MQASRSRVFLLGCVMVLILVVVAVFGPFIAPHSISTQNLRNRMGPPSSEHPLGTDLFGRDVLSRIILGSRVSLSVGLAGIALGGLIGSVIGLAAGYGEEKWFDVVALRIVDILMSFPTLILGILVVAVLGPGLEKTIVAIGIAFTARYIRLVRGEVLSVKQRAYIEAARALGASYWRILLKHILPNVSTPLIVMSTLWLASSVLIESSLSFLGLGVQPPTPSWGVMIKEGSRYLTINPMLVVFPGIAIAFTVYAFIMAGDGLQDLLDPRMRGVLRRRKKRSKG